LSTLAIVAVAPILTIARDEKRFAPLKHHGSTARALLHGGLALRQLGRHDALDHLLRIIRILRARNQKCARKATKTFNELDISWNRAGRSTRTRHDTPRRM